MSGSLHHVTAVQWDFHSSFSFSHVETGGSARHTYRADVCSSSKCDGFSRSRKGIGQNCRQICPRSKVRGCLRGLQLQPGRGLVPRRFLFRTSVGDRAGAGFGYPASTSLLNLRAAGNRRAPFAALGVQEGCHD